MAAMAAKGLMRFMSRLHILPTSITVAAALEAVAAAAEAVPVLQRETGIKLIREHRAREAKAASAAKAARDVFLFIIRKEIVMEHGILVDRIGIDKAGNEVHYIEAAFLIPVVILRKEQ